MLLSSVTGQPVTGVATKRVASGLNQPLFVTAPPGDFSRLFIVSRLGRIYILNLSTGVVNTTTPFLNINSSVYTSGERGLLGMAFDPNYASNGKFYLNYMVSGGAFNGGKTRISQFTVSSDPNVADPNSEKILLSYDQVRGDHNGGWLGFSPRSGDDNNLYICVGDGGCCNDQGNGHADPGNGQNTTVLLGKILRIHVDAATGTYTIPTGNPFAASTTDRQEVWAYGVRNPFRASFDRGTGIMYIGDVGEATREEVDVQLPGNPGGGENYGWRLREGLIATPTGNPVVGGAPPPGYVDPIVDYTHFVGASVIGGYVYRGNEIPYLQGKYIFGEYTAAKMFALSFDGVTASGFEDITSRLFPTLVGGYTLVHPSSLGEDAAGELYITDIGNGNLFKIVPLVKITNVTRLANGHFMVSGIGVPLRNHIIQAASSLTDQFLNLAPPVTAAADGTFQFEDVNSGGMATRFYRAMYP